LIILCRSKKNREYERPREKYQKKKKNAIAIAICIKMCIAAAAIFTACAPLATTASAFCHFSVRVPFQTPAKCSTKIVLVLF